MVSGDQMKVKINIFRKIILRKFVSVFNLIEFFEKLKKQKRKLGKVFLFEEIVKNCSVYIVSGAAPVGKTLEK